MTENEAARAFEADWWPLEMAVAWLATGRRRYAALAGEMAYERRLGNGRPSTLGAYLRIMHIMAAHETVHGSFFRAEARGAEFENDPKSGSRLYVVPSGQRYWTHDGVTDMHGEPLPPDGKLWLGEPHRSADAPIRWAINTVVRMMWHKPARGRSPEGDRGPIPAALWKGAAIIDDDRHGLCVASRRTNRIWHDVDVPAAVFRTWRSKRGRRTALLNPENANTKAMSHAVLLLRFSKSSPAKPQTISEIAEHARVGDDTVARLSRTVNKTGFQSKKGRPAGRRNRKRS